MTYALALDADGHTVTIRSNTPTVTDWAARYFGPHWTVTPGDSDGVTAPVITALDGGAPTGDPTTHPRHAVFARDRIGYTRHPDGTVTAHTLTDPTLAYRYTPTTRHLEITSHLYLAAGSTPGRPTRLATAVTRLAREMMRAQLLTDGWTLLHASAAVLPDGQALLALGRSGAGKTTTALTLAATGAALLASDCCFARPNRHGTLDLLPWPAAAAIGLGLLDALSYTTAARAHLTSGEPPHPTQDQRVTNALISAHPTPVRTTSGRELKAHIWPDQLIRWFGLSLAATAAATTVLLPRITPSPGIPAQAEQARSQTATPDVFVTSEDEERYPDLFGLVHGSAAGNPTARTAVLTVLNHLPKHAVNLSHDHATNAQVLSDLVRLTHNGPG
ncbi:hypothetical protein ACGRHY_27625 [Streptomyces sp. HK10]|uniref:hypothetical protein n=1 Tax=Streptomyces sp. HK10 TaxID=3373255 RepID=UPI003748814A